MYRDGQGVIRDYAQARKWFRLAAAQGSASSQSNLGVMYDNGQGVPQDYTQALKWYRLAAAQGDASALNNLGVAYMYGARYGAGVPSSKVVAYALYNLSVSIDSSNGNFAKENRGKVSAQMSHSEIEAGEALSLEMAKPGNLLRALDACLAQKKKR